jgi:ankyrin repeat protein/L-ascorbate metabolism protein UlaG (beta-lactamase superfamily)
MKKVLVVFVILLCGMSQLPLQSQEQRGGAGNTQVSIFEAAEQGNLDAAALLLKKDPKLVDLKNADGETALHLAAGCRRGEEAALPLVRLLLENGAAPDARNGSNQSPLLYAAYGGFSRVVELLIAKGVAVQYQDTNGRSPLHYAAREGRPQVVEILLKHGANPALKDKESRTPLEYAVLRNKPAVVQTLMKLVRYDIKGPDGSTLLHAAASWGQDDMVRSLIEQGADAARSSPNGDPILLSYLRGGLAARAMESIARGADVKAKDAAGWTALHLAVEKGLDQVVSALLDKGADPNAIDKNGLTPLDIARDWGFRSADALLSAKGAQATPLKVHVLKGGAFEIAALPAGAKGETAVIRYIGTDGFLIEAGSKTVLVDGLVSNPWGYTNTPERALTQMKAALPPFERLDLLLFSHAHRDHFEPKMALDVLSARTQAFLIGDGLVSGELRDAGAEAFKSLEPRIKTMDTKMGQRTTLTVNGIPLTVLGVNHGEANRPYLTLGYIMQLGKFRIYHQGDIYPDSNLPFLASLPWESEKIDIAFFDPFFLQNAETRRIVLERIKPSAVILMHMRDDEVEGYVGQIKPAVPQVLGYLRPMESKVFVKAGPDSGGAPAPEGSDERAAPEPEIVRTTVTPSSRRADVVIAGGWKP